MDYLDIKNWIEDPTVKIDEEKFLRLIIEGLDTCPEEEYCDSREIWGKDKCDCVREALPNPLYYEIYKGLRELCVLLKLEQEILGGADE